MKKPDIIRLIISILIPQAAGGIGSLFTMDSVHTWYQTLSKPSFNPPDWIFGPVWTLLYIMMGIALYLVWKNGLGTSQAKLSVVFFSIQLILNVAWSFLFFYLRMPVYGFIEIIILWIFILFTMLAFFRINLAAGILLAPYLLWVSFAAILNFFLWRLNQ
ncbi:MAG: tryptophan-rich sensory protein [Spirochaetes bacterium]|nr:tryptophan-rich sensory protein [Spirochaetota bacterium]